MMISPRRRRPGRPEGWQVATGTAKGTANWNNMDIYKCIILSDYILKAIYVHFDMILFNTNK